MKTQIVYILVSRNSDYYTEQTMLSIFSLLKHNPEAKITVVCDEETGANLNQNSHFINLGKINVIAKHFDETVTLKERSRHLKTTLRHIIKGDYLFIDSDTLICSSLSNIDHCPADLAMVYDTNRCDLINESDASIIERCKLIDPAVSVLGHPYFNSGVMYVKDVPATHDLYHKWHSAWQSLCSQGLCYDQPPLCVSLLKSNIEVQRLDDNWNYQFKYGCSPNRFTILHYLTQDGKFHAFDKPYIFLIFEEIRAYGFLRKFIDEIIMNPAIRFIPLFEVGKESFADQCTSKLAYIHHNAPHLYKLAEQLTFGIYSIKCTLSKLKTKCLRLTH